MSFERRPKNLRFGAEAFGRNDSGAGESEALSSKVKNRDYKVAVSVLQHPNRIFSGKQKQLASIFDGLLLMLVFLKFPHESLGVIDLLRLKPPVGLRHPSFF